MTPNKHLNGEICPLCANSENVREMELYNFIKSNFNSYNVIYQYMNKSILGLQSIDIYIPKYKIGIEYQGDQHFKAVDFFGGEEGFEKTIKRDETKFNKCKDNGITLLYFTFNKKYNKTPFGEYIYNDKYELLESIKKKKGG